MAHKILPAKPFPYRPAVDCRQLRTNRRSQPDKCIRVFARRLVLIWALSWGLIGSSPTGANELALQDRLFTQLTRPMQSIVDGRSLREAINSIARQTQLNVWLDRRVDPSVPVALGPIGPTPFAALEQLAESSGCVVMPIENVILIGHQKWVDQTSATLMSLDLNDSLPAVEIAWDDLTTPHEALRKAVGADVDLDTPLPHDLWPAVGWQGVDRRVAATLILAQFDRRPVSTESVTNLATEPATSRGQFRRRYTLAKYNSDFRKVFLRAARANRAEFEGGSVSAAGNVTSHRIALTSVLASIRPKSVDIDRSTFTIKRMRTTAKNAFEQLAKMAGRTCRIETDVNEACQNTVSVEGTDLTLRELTARVASEVGVTATWVCRYDRYLCTNRSRSVKNRSADRRKQPETSVMTNDD